jgi:hypothetical protein
MADLRAEDGGLALHLRAVPLSAVGAVRVVELAGTDYVVSADAAAAVATSIRDAAGVG